MPAVLLFEMVLKRILLVASVFRRGVKVHAASTTASSSLLMAAALHTYHGLAFVNPLAAKLVTCQGVHAIFGRSAEDRARVIHTRHSISTVICNIPSLLHVAPGGHVGIIAKDMRAVPR